MFRVESLYSEMLVIHNYPVDIFIVKHIITRNLLIAWLIYAICIANKTSQSENRCKRKSCKHSAKFNVLKSMFG